VVPPPGLQAAAPAEHQVGKDQVGVLHQGQMIFQDLLRTRYGTLYAGFCSCCAKWFVTDDRGHKYCSRICSSYGTTLTSQELRDLFLSRVTKTKTCWLYDGKKENKYASTQHARQIGEVYAHRAAYVLFNGRIKKGAIICHTCDVPSCVRPSHLFAGTYSDNNTDSVRKGRWNIRKTRGGRNGRKLTKDAVLCIRSQCIPGRSGNVLRTAIKYGVSTTTIHAILKRKTWTHTIQEVP